MEENDGPHATRKSTLSTLPSARALIAFSHTAGENFIRIMPGVAQAIEEVLRSGHVPRAHGRLFAIQVGGLAVVSARRCFQRTSRHSLCEHRKRKRRRAPSRGIMRLPGDLATDDLYLSLYGTTNQRTAFKGGVPSNRPPEG